MIRHLIAAAARRRLVRSAVADLDRLDDSQLDDIGLSRDDIERLRATRRFARRG